MIDASLLLDGTVSAAGVVAGSAITVTRASTNVLDLLSARDIGGGDDIEMHVQVLTAFTAAGAATLEIAFQTSATAGGTYVDLIRSPVIAVADLTVGSQVFRYKLPVMQLNEKTSPKQFIRLNYTVSTGPMTAGAIFAYLTGGGDRQVTYTYPNNYTAA